MLTAGSILFINNEVTFVEVIVPLIALMSSFGPVVAISNLSNNLFHTLAAGNRVLDLLEEEPVVRDVEGREKSEFGDISCDNITFSYGEEEILKDFSMDLKRDSVIGIFGKSGSGKSTLLRLLMRFWEVNEGEISINNKNINEINTNDL
ncbi:ATP-binding cassette domain-containing protein, partial [Romboutsia sp. 13368]|uniref:ATP-binding cassette domain-containing protein n=1 Tax=Romboutsia sp. 13368 TaxID=2708053 RepID=UPI0025E5CA3E